MTVSIDGNAVSATTVLATSWTNYTTAATINAGTHTLSIAFTNARQRSSCSRLLFLDTVTVTAAAWSPTPGIWSGGTLTNTWQQFSDLNSVFDPAFVAAPVPNNPVAHLQSMTTPYGPGFSFTCSDTDVAIWNSQAKIINNRVNNSGDPAGTVVQYTTYINLPSQTFSKTGYTQNGWFTGDLWEFHTNTTNPSIQVDVTNSPIAPTPAWRVMLPTDDNVSWTDFYGPAITFNTWHQLVVQVYWSNTANGFHRWYIDGQLIANHTAANWWSDAGNPFIEYGYYAGRGGVTNYAQFGPLTRQVFATGMP
jgi:hypothetical protein